MNKVKITYLDGSVRVLDFHHLKMKAGKLQLFDESGKLITEESDIDEFEEQSEAKVLEERTGNFIALLNKNANHKDDYENTVQQQKESNEAKRKKEEEANSIDNILRRVGEKFNEQKQESYDEETELSSVLIDSLSKYNTIRQKSTRFNLTGFVEYLRIHRPNLLAVISDDDYIVKEQIELAICDLLRNKKVSYAPFYHQETYTIINKYKHEVRGILRNNPDNMKIALDVFKMTNAGEKINITLIDWMVYFLKSNLGRR